jgi:hypothetical protein
MGRNGEGEKCVGEMAKRRIGVLYVHAYSLTLFLFVDNRVGAWGIASINISETINYLSAPLRLCVRLGRPMGNKFPISPLPWKLSTISLRHPASSAV